MGAILINWGTVHVDHVRAEETMAVALHDRYRPVVTSLVYRESDDTYLILKRSEKLPVYPGMWTVPGGGLERKDYFERPQTSPDGWDNVLEVALLREIREEAGITVKNVRYRGNTVFIRPDMVPVIVLRHYAQYASGDVVLDPADATDYRWIRPYELSQYDLIGNIPADILWHDTHMNWR